MSKFIIGTAGHIDHGKTSLIKALTGINSDRLKEERKRGISIVNGYAYLKKEDDYISIIDVPGHERFIQNMLSGITGINFVIIVVSADESIMPQTVEHMDIIKLLGIKNGVICITKIDACDKEYTEIVTEEIKDYVEGTIFENYSILEVSSKTNEGIEELRELIFKEFDEYLQEDNNYYPRLLIDRVFLSKGHGKIVTGTLEENDLDLKLDYVVYPANYEVKIKTIQSHDRDLKIAKKNSRVALNINYEKQINKGDIISVKDKYFVNNSVIVRLELLDGFKDNLNLKLDYKFYLGTKEIIGRFIHLDKDFYEILFKEKYLLYKGQRGIVRSFSPVNTIGGIEVLDPNPLMGRKNKIDLSKKIDKLSSFDYIMYKNPNGISKSQFFKEIYKDDYYKKDIIEFDEYYFSFKSLEAFSNNFIKNLKKIYSKDNLLEWIEKEQVRSRYYGELPRKLFDQLVNNMNLENLIEVSKAKIKIKDYKINLDEKMQERIIRIINDYKNYHLSPPSLKELNDIYDEQDNRVIRYLLQIDKLFAINNEFFLLKDFYITLKNDIIRIINKNGYLTIDDIREEYDLSRKFIVSYLEYFDSSGLTKRIENKRYLKKGVVHG